MEALLTDEQKMRKWVETWKQAGPELERIKTHELRELDIQKSASMTHDLLLMADQALGLNPRPPRPDSGMVEQQRIFRKWWQHRI